MYLQKNDWKYILLGAVTIFILFGLGSMALIFITRQKNTPPAAPQIIPDSPTPEVSILPIRTATNSATKLER